MRRIDYLDGLRACAALYVVMHHTLMMAFPILLGVRTSGPVSVVTWPLLFGQLGVTIFIVLAGFSLSIGVARKHGELPGGLVGFMWKRARRIIPPYWIALAITVVLAVFVINTPSGTHWDQSLPQSKVGWAADFLLLQDVTPGARNAAYTFWSIAVEWHIYLTLPLMLWVRRLSGRWLTAIAAGVAIGMALLALEVFEPRLGRVWPEFFLLFALGMGMCVLLLQYPERAARLPWGWGTIGLATATVLSMLMEPSSWSTGEFPWLNILAGLTTLALIGALETGRFGRLRSLFVSSWLTGIGAFSYSLYLVHAPILEVAWRFAIQPLHLSRGVQLAVGLIIIVPVLVGVSWVFSIYFERPFMNHTPLPSREGLVHG